MKYKKALPSFALLFWVDIFMMPFTVVWAAAAGELVPFMNVMFEDPAMFAQLSGTALLGGVRALTQYNVLEFVTATSLGMANIFSQTLNILISIPIQHIE